MHHSRILIAVALSAAVAGGCNKVKAPSGLPTSVPSVPGGSSGEVDPNTCGNYAASDAGAKLKVFLQATKDLEVATEETAKVVKQSCILMGQELGMAEGDLGGDDTGAICNKVIAAYKDNLKVTMKGGAALKIKFVPGKCTVDASASASASGGCSGGASAGTGGSGAGGQCAAKLVLDKTKLDMTIKAMTDGLPKLFDVQARIAPIKDAAAAWAASAKDLAAMGPKFAQSFADQALCIGGQIGATANAATHIQANVNVSVSVSASASGSVGG